jgi:BirA family biotin operon repressor/biotin-[acetyl-CoA-carboxylase] ligase
MSQSNFETLIDLLADGEFHSGEEIGRHLQVSRAAVWKQLQKLSRLELSVESVKGKGYRLSQSIELLNKEVIIQGLNKTALVDLISLDCLCETESTNSVVMNHFSSANITKGYVCLSEYQSQGKGRRGRRWVSPFGANLYLSLAWSFEEGVSALEGLSLTVGLAVARALAIQGLTGVQLKWPNDILCKGRKLGGVLIEMTGDPAGRCDVVIGVGVNISMTQEQLSSAEECIEQPWIAAQEILPSISRNALASSLVNQLFSILNDYSSKGFGAYKEEWQKHDAFIDQQVQLVSGQNKQSGIARGVNDNGALLLEVDEKVVAVHGGELSLRLKHDT